MENKFTLGYKYKRINIKDEEKLINDEIIHGE